MACMCGDICCWSCGPAQGNGRCPICGAWASDACDHFDEESGELKQEFAAEAERLAREEAEAEQAALDAEAALYARWRPMSDDDR